MSRRKKSWRRHAAYFIPVFSFNLYFIFLMQERQIKYLLYLDFLLFVFFLLSEGIAFFSFYKRERIKKELLMQDEPILWELGDFENRDIAEHDVRLLENKLQEKFQEGCELQDYVAKWCHEFKIPLAAGLLIAEKIRDAEVRRDMRAQLEKMNWQSRAMLQGCRMQSPLFDIQIEKVSLEECVRASIRNNQFFLIQKRFSIDIQVSEERVYTDRTWMTYILDQLINNAIKYAAKAPCLKIWTEEKNGFWELVVWDNGEGIEKKDIRRIFEKGFTGSNVHNGKYKSTGMGLYLVTKIADKLACHIDVESEYGEYTRFCIGPFTESQPKP